MGRLLAIDYGRRRCGLAVTDSLRIVATALATVPTAGLVEYISAYIASEPVDEIIVGMPRDVHGRESESMQYIRPGIRKLHAAFPSMKITFFDERFTSVLAHRSMIDCGMKKMQRRDKAAVDKMAATIILNDYLQSKLYNDK